MINPMLIYTYCSLSPQDVQKKSKCCLPVFWRSSKNVWVMKQLLLEWFNSCFVDEVECYVNCRNLALLVSFALDSAPVHSWNFDLTHSDIQIEYLQLLNQGILMTLYSCYSSFTCCSILDASEKQTLLVSVSAGNFTVNPAA